MAFRRRSRGRRSFGRRRGRGRRLGSYTMQRGGIRL